MKNKEKTVSGRLLGETKNFLYENKVILFFVVLCLVCILISGMNLTSVTADVFTRFGRNACLVLALIIPCLAGLGMNFGIVVGAAAAQLAIFAVVHWGFTGIWGFLLCVLLSTPLALLFGWLVGILYNHTKGSEMIAGLVVGFFADGLYRLFVLYIIGGLIPYEDPNLLPRGFGLRNSFDLTGNIKYALDDISFLTTLTVISALMLIVTTVNFLYAKKKQREAPLAGFLVRMGIYAALLVVSIVGHSIPFLNKMLGGTRLLFSDAVKLGAAAAIVYAIVTFLVKRPKPSEKSFVRLCVIAGAAILAIVLLLIPAVKKVFVFVKLPACTYAVIVLFCLFNNWLLSTRLGQNMRTVGQSRSVATSAGIHVDRTRIIATCISTVLAAWGQLIYLQNLGTFNTVQQQSNVGLYAVAAILVGGANVQKANNKQAVIGVFLFHTFFVVAPSAAEKLVGDPAIAEYIRMFICYGVIAVSLAMYAWKKKPAKKKRAK